MQHQKRRIATDFQRLRNELLPCGCVVIGKVAVDVGVEFWVGHAKHSLVDSFSMEIFTQLIPVRHYITA